MIFSHYGKTTIKKIMKTIFKIRVIYSQLLIILLTNSCEVRSQNIDSSIVSYFGIQDYRIIQYKSEFEWQIVADNYNTIYVRKNNNILYDSIVEIKDIAYKVEKYLIKENKIMHYDSTVVYVKNKDEVFNKIFEVIYSKKGQLKRQIHYMNEVSVWPYKLYSRIVCIAINDTVFIERFYDEKNRLRVKGKNFEDKYYGEWIFYDNKGRIEAKGYATLDYPFLKETKRSYLNIGESNLTNKVYMYWLESNRKISFFKLNKKKCL